MIDLSTAMNFISALKERGAYRGEKIGRVVKDCYGCCGWSLAYGEGDIVLFREQLPPNSSLGEYHGMKQEPTGFLTVERPLTQAEIGAQMAKGYLLAMGTMVGVPADYVEEIIVG